MIRRRPRLGTPAQGILGSTPLRPFSPCRFAVALKYDLDDMDVPALVAKGQDFLAQTIRELVEEHNIPIVENPPIARALYAGVEIDQEIPQEHFKAVAEIIGYVFRLKGKLPPSR